MFGHRYFGAAYFGPHYWGPAGGGVIPPEGDKSDWVMRLRRRRRNTKGI